MADTIPTPFIGQPVNAVADASAKTHTRANTHRELPPRPASLAALAKGPDAPTRIGLIAFWWRPGVDPNCFAAVPAALAAVSAASAEWVGGVFLF